LILKINLERHQHDEISDKLMNSSVVKLFAGHCLLGDEAVRQTVEEAVVEGSIQDSLVLLL